MNVRRFSFALCLAVAPLAMTASAHAADPPPPAATPVSSARGVAVVAQPAAIDPAWALARALYGDPQLKPASLDEPRARVLAGDAPPPNAPPALRDLADVRGSIKGEDAPSRKLLASLARDLDVRAIVVVSPPPKPTARVFVADTGAFDAATYAADDAQGSSWSATKLSLARSFATVTPALAPALAPAPALALSPAPAPAPALAPAPLLSAPSLATHEGPRIDNTPPGPRKFYQSAWFWGAIGAAAFAGTAVFFATRDNSAGTIHLQMQVPK